MVRVPDAAGLEASNRYLDPAEGPLSRDLAALVRMAVEAEDAGFDGVEVNRAAAALFGLPARGDVARDRCQIITSTNVDRSVTDRHIAHRPVLVSETVFEFELALQVHQVLHTLPEFLLRHTELEIDQRECGKLIPAVTQTATSSLVEFNETQGTRINQHNTVGGLIVHQLGHLPRRGERVEIGRFRFVVIRADDRRVHLLKVIVASGNGDATDSTTS